MDDYRTNACRNLLVMSAVLAAPDVVRFDIHQLRLGKGNRFGGRWAKSLVGGAAEEKPVGRKRLARELFVHEHGAPDDVEGLRSAVEGTFGGLSVHVSKAEFHPSGVDFWVDIHNADGVKVGKAHREISEDNEGNLYADHAYLSLYPDVQGQGFAEAFNSHLEDWYRESGVGRIELHANIDVGGYSWARQGYDFRDGVPTEVRDKLAAAITDRLPRALADQYRVVSAYDGSDIVYDLHGPKGPLGRFQFYDEAEAAISNALIADHARGPHADDDVRAAVALLDRIDAGERLSAYEISQVGREPGQSGPKETWIGKDAMLGSEWYGVKWLDAAADRVSARPAGGRHRSDGRHRAAA